MSWASTTAKTLKLDYDGPIPQQLRALLAFAEATLRVKVVRIARKRSASGQGWHVRVELNRALPVSAVVALQSILGSDARREVFNLSRALVLSDAPQFWRDRWNVLYSAKLGDSYMLDIAKYGTDKQLEKQTSLKPDHIDAPYAVFTVANVREVLAARGGKGSAKEPQLVLEFAELPGFVYWANFSGIKKLIHGLGIEEREWFGKRIVLEKRTARNPETGEPTTVLWVADSRTWDQHFRDADAAGRKRGRGGRKTVRRRATPEKVAPVAKRGSKKAR